MITSGPNMMKHLFLLACMWRMPEFTDAILSNARHQTPTTPGRRNAQNIRFEFQFHSTPTNYDTERVTKSPCLCPDDESSGSYKTELEDAKEAFFATLGGLWAATTVPY